MKKLVLIDSNALVHRAFHALPPLAAPDGRMTNAVYGFTSVLIKMLQDLKPDYIAATFDLAGPTFRHDAYEDYKAHRVKAPDELYAQIPLVKDMLGAFGIPIFEKEGYEADDVIGTIAEQARHLPDLQTIIVTGDLDTLQLVHGKKVIVFTLKKGVTDTITYDEDGVHTRYGLSPAQVPDFKGLKGDPSDNIPGVKGVGEKTAATLIQTYGSIEQLYEQIDSADISEKLRAKLVEGKDMALFSKKLATIVLNVPLTFTLDQADWHTHADAGAIERICKELGFYSLAKRVLPVLGVVAQQAATQTLDLDGTRAAASLTATHIARPSDLPAGDTLALHAVIDQDIVTALYLTTDGERVWELSTPSSDDVRDIIQRCTTLIGHDIKPFLKTISPEAFAYPSLTLIDTHIAAWLINPELRDYSLERVLYDTTGQTLDNNPATLAVASWRLYPLLWDKLKHLDLLRVYSDIETPLIPVLAAMEKRGIRVDTRTIDDLLTLARDQIATLERTIYKEAGGEFNINSPAQLADILFTKLAIRGKVRRTGGGSLSTAAPELEKLRDEHPIIGHILEYRELAKLKNTYIEPFPMLIAADSRLHTTYNQTGTATGRISSSDPNLQNIPTRTELGQRFRAAFVADPGWKFISLDYSQLELRIVAHVAHDETMIEAFRNGEDIHTRTASEVFGIAPGQVTKDMRRQAKVLNFGIIYGMGVLGFARAAGVNRDQARHFIDEYFKRFSGVAAYMARTKEEVFKEGFVRTLFGRRRPLPDIKSTIPQLAATAERMAINHPIQGTGADLMKLAMIQCARHLEQNDHARILLQVHDELVVEVQSAQVATISEELRTIMEHVHPFDVPLIVDVKSGDNWSDMTPTPHP